jgi:hypothetical protein
MSCRERLAANRPLEWTGNQEFFAASTQTPNLPRRDSIRLTHDKAISVY